MRLSGNDLDVDIFNSMVGLTDEKETNNMSSLSQGVLSRSPE